MTIKSTQQSAGKAQRLAQEKANFKGTSKAYVKKVEDCEIKEKKKKIITRVALGLLNFLTLFIFRKR